MIDWKAAWENDNAPWHQTEINSTLIKHLPKITNNKAGAKLFFPLCGKALDILEMGKLGHHIVGVEFSEIAVQQFFKENKLPFSTTQIPEVGGVLYANEENNIKIYCCDFFQFGPSLEKDFDGVWDCGGLEAIEIDKREAYINIVKSICKSDAGYLLETADRPPCVGPPFYMKTEDVVKMFGLNCEPEQVDYEHAVPILKELGCAGVYFYYFKMPHVS